MLGKAQASSAQYEIKNVTRKRSYHQNTCWVVNDEALVRFKTNGLCYSFFSFVRFSDADGVGHDEEWAVAAFYGTESYESKNK